MKYAHGWVRLFGSLAIVLGVGALHADPVTIKLTTLAPKNSSYHRSLQRMGETWRAASGGTVELVIYAGGIQGGEAAMVERMRIDQVQAGLLTATGLEELEPGVSGLQNMPMMFRSLDELDVVARALEPKLEARMLERGFVVLAWADTGWVRFFSRKPVTHVGDLKELKLFAWAGDTDATDVMTRAGLKPVPLETTDILSGLETGLIDAVPAPPYYALATQIYRAAPYMLDLNWGPLVGALVISKRAWERVPAELRPALSAAAVKAGGEIQSAGRNEATEAVRVMRDKWGLKVQAVTPEIEAEWRQAAEAAYPAIRGPIVPAEIFDEVQRLLAQHRASTAPSR